MTTDGFPQAVEVTIKGRLRRGYISAVATGYGQGIMFWVYATVMYMGAVLVDNGTLTFLNFFSSFFAVAFGAYGVGRVSEPGFAFFLETTTAGVCVVYILYCVFVFWGGATGGTEWQPFPMRFRGIFTVLVCFWDYELQSVSRFAEATSDV